MSTEIIEDEVERKVAFCATFGWKEWHRCLEDNIYKVTFECRRLREENAALRKFIQDAYVAS